MKKLALILILAIFIPQLASAAWWNPASWFNGGQDPEKAELVARLAALEDKINHASSTEVLDIKVPEIKEKVVTQTIKVDNPELQAKINILIKQNSDLVSKYNELTTRYNSSISQLNQCKADSFVNNSEDTQRSQKLKEIDLQILPILDSFLSQQDGYGDIKYIPSLRYPPIEDINKLLASYRLIDSRMTHPDLSVDIIKNLNGMFSSITELRNYLTDIYIKYR